MEGFSGYLPLRVGTLQVMYLSFQPVYFLSPHSSAAKQNAAHYSFSWSVNIVSKDIKETIKK